MRTLLSARPEPAETTVTEELRDKPEFLTPRGVRDAIASGAVGTGVPENRRAPEGSSKAEAWRFVWKPGSGIFPEHAGEPALSSELETTSGGHHRDAVTLLKAAQPLSKKGSLQNS